MASQTSSARRARVVIVGAGFGGLERAKALSRSPVDIVLVDRTNHHLFQPLLYQVATAALAPNDVAWPTRSIVRNRANITTLLDEVESVDLVQRRVICRQETLEYDYLVLATGATHAYFGHDEWSAFAPGLKRLEDATAIRRDLLLAFETAERLEDDVERQRLMTFVIVGGGPTGVEMAGAIAELARRTLAHDYRRIDPEHARIVLVEAGARVLGTYPEDLSAYAAKALTRLGVEVKTDVRVTSIDESGVDTSAGRIDASNVLWAAGVAASPAAKWIGAQQDRSGRALVEPDLSIHSAPNVFVIGDAASAKDRHGKPVPGIAPAAKQMGKHAARTILARLQGKPPPGPFRYRHSGDLATIGRNAAVVRFKSLKLTGFAGWVFWSVAHIYFLISARHRIAVAFNWAWDYITGQRSVRLIIADHEPDGGARLDAAPALHKR